jgi:hypothetical protein
MSICASIGCARSRAQVSGPIDTGTSADDASQHSVPRLLRSRSRTRRGECPGHLERGAWEGSAPARTMISAAAMSRSPGRYEAELEQEPTAVADLAMMPQWGFTAPAGDLQGPPLQLGGLDLPRSLRLRPPIHQEGVGGETRRLVYLESSMITSSGLHKNRSGRTVVPIQRLTYSCELPRRYQP